MNPFFKTLQLIWFSLLLGPLMFLVVTLVVIEGQMYAPDLVQIMTLICPVLMLGMVATSQILFQQLLQKAKSSEMQETQMKAYQSASVIKFALIEGANLFGIIAFLLTQAYWILALVGGCFVWMILQRPTPQKYAEDMQS
jgi:hypothetical protein